MRLHFVLTLSALLLLLPACREKGSDRQRQELPSDVKDAAGVIASKNPERFAGACSYPVLRPYPLRDITDSAEMVKYYEILVDDSLRDVVRHAADTDWSEFGWRGWTLHDGEYVWIDDGRIYDIPYVSAAEKSLRDILVEREMSTLPKDMRLGWTPAECLHDLDDGSIYRIDMSTDSDADPDSLYRIAVYSASSPMTLPPARVMRGTMKVEGSAAVRTYYFRDVAGASIEYSPDVPDDGQDLSVIFKTAGESPEAHRVAKAYWRDWFSPDCK